ncbi:MAG: LamB/YcsF family protein [Ferruginibacter sp.]|nr:LamB/YcsF family protein [Ferruginibacter sp.]
MGEGIGNEALLMPYIHASNIACGYHAGDEATMEQVVNLCLQYGVHIGAHPSFPDRANFGRTAMQLSLADIYTLVTDQLTILNTVVVKKGAGLHHVKPHGALYNMAAQQTPVAHAIARAVRDFDPSLVYYGLSGSVMIDMAQEEGLQTANEVFADRTYQPDGSLTPRSQPDALITHEALMLEQVLRFIQEQRVRTITGEEIPIKADTICIHGDGVHALAFAKAIHTTLREKNIIP